MAEQKNNHQEMNVEEAISQSEAFIIKHKTTIIGVVAAIIIIIAGAMLYKHYIAAPREAKAAAAIFKAEQYFGQNAYEQALNGDSLGNKGFIAIADEYSSTESGNLAKAYAGISYAQLGKYEEAVKYLNNFSGDDQMVAPAVLGALGNCYANLDQLDKATSTLVKAADKADNMTLSPVYLLQAGEIYEKQGKLDDAISVYTKIKEKYFNSYQAMDIDKYIDRAKALKK